MEEAKRMWTNPNSRKSNNVMLKLKQDNDDLRNQLKSLNAQLDEVLSRPIRQEGSGDSNLYIARNKVLQSIQQQMSLQEKEIEALREKSVTSSLTRKIELEKEKEELKEEIKQLSVDNKRFSRRVKEADEKITSQNIDPEEVVVFKRLNDEFRREKDKLAKLQETYNHAKQQHENAKEKIQTLAVQDVKNNTVPVRGTSDPMDDFEPQSIPIDASDINKIKKTLEDLEKSKAATETKDKKRLAEITPLIDLSQIARNEIANKLKEKEKESRILEHRIRDAKRKIRMLNFKGKSSAPDFLGDFPESVSVEPTPNGTDIPKSLFPAHTKNTLNSITSNITPNMISDTEFEIKSEMENQYIFEKPSIDDKIPLDEFKIKSSYIQDKLSSEDYKFDKPKFDFGGSKVRGSSRGSSKASSRMDLDSEMFSKKLEYVPGLGNKEL